MRAGGDVKSSGGQVLVRIHPHACALINMYVLMDKWVSLWGKVEGLWQNLGELEQVWLELLYRGINRENCTSRGQLLFYVRGVEGRAQVDNADLCPGRM